MPDEYFEIDSSATLSSVGELAIARARALGAAIERNRDFAIVALQRRSSYSEVIIVDVDTDDVPPQNSVGIGFRERVALIVWADEKQLVEARPLRKAFPVLPHQNAVLPGEPPSLCLYFEPAMSVARTWTPQAFLRRVQWWLAKSARSELHPADQPVEMLFFSSNRELVLPWNYAALRKNPIQRFAIGSQGERPGDAATYFLHPIPADDWSGSTGAACIDLVMPEIVHGTIERNPGTLGDLSDALAGRGVELFAPLKEALAKRVPPEGLPLGAEQPLTVFLLHVPILRKVGDTELATVMHRAFFVDKGALELGVDIGVLYRLNQRYYNVTIIGGADATVDWRCHQIMPVDVLQENTRAAARRQSGIVVEGPNAVLIGAGSLGSAMLNLWGRSGWGSWTVIDKDHIKPHNLSRHTAYVRHIGQLKTAVVAELHKDAIREGGIAVIFGDVCDPYSKETCRATANANIVIDASATLEYPRLASTNDRSVRHISAFITPSGSDAVLLAEDDERVVRLRSLEAQYYRAIIQEAWGIDHLAGNAGTYWSGAGCRDISVVVPYSRITAHASTLAEQIPIAAGSPTAAIRIWQRWSDTGAVAVRDVSVYPETEIPMGPLTLYFDQGVEELLRSMRDANLPNETGGVLLGYYDFNVNAILVVCGLPAPPDSVSTPTSFERGTVGLVDAVNEATRRTAGIVGYIGEWHSHPDGHTASQSGMDVVQLCHLAFGMADDGLPGLQLIVGEDDVRVFQGRRVDA